MGFRGIRLSLVEVTEKVWPLGLGGHVISKVVFGSGRAGDSPDSILSLDLCVLYLQAGTDNGWDTFASGSPSKLSNARSPLHLTGLSAPQVESYMELFLLCFLICG